MYRVLLISDPHVHCHKRRTERLDDCLKTLDWTFKTAAERNITDIIFGGDLFHDRQKIEVFTYHKTFKKFEEYCRPDLNIWLLLGNHDLWFFEDTSISSVTPLSSLPGVKVISTPTRIKIANSNWDFIPYTHNPIQVIEDLKKLPGESEYAIGHLAIDGAKLHGNTYSDVVIEHDGDMVPVNSDIFSGYKQVFLGHYHEEQRVSNNVEYIGSPLQLSFGEAFQQKHIIDFNCQTGEKDYIINNFSPQHFIIPQEDIKKYDLNNNFIKILVDEIGASDLVQMRRELITENNIGSLEIKQKKKEISEHVIEDAKAILYKDDEMLVRYLDEVGTEGLDKDKLLKIGKEICVEEAK